MRSKSARRYRLLTITSFIAGNGLAVSEIAQPGGSDQGMVVTPFEQVNTGYPTLTPSALSGI